MIVVPAADAEPEVGASVGERPAAAGGETAPWPSGALADEPSALEIADIKPAPQEALLGDTGQIASSRSRRRA